MNRIILFIAYCIFTYLSLSVAIGTPFSRKFDYTIGVFTNMINNPVDGLLGIFFLYFPITICILITLGVYYIFFFARNFFGIKPITNLIILYVGILTSLIFVGVILRLIIADRDYDIAIMHFLKNFAYSHLEISNRYFVSMFLFEFALPIAFLFFICGLWLKRLRLREHG